MELKELDERDYALFYGEDTEKGYLYCQEALRYYQNQYPNKNIIGFPAEVKLEPLTGETYFIYLPESWSIEETNDFAKALNDYTVNKRFFVVPNEAKIEELDNKTLDELLEKLNKEKEKRA